MAVQPRWDLPAKIIGLSQASTWKEAIREWKLVEIELLEPGESKTCLCGHKPIRELCHIKNTKNGMAAIIGNHCIERFADDELEDADFESVPRIFQASQRLLINPKASANDALINHAFNVGVLTEREKTFYLDIWRKRNLTPRQAEYKRTLNTKLLYRIILSTQAAFKRLKVAPQNQTAGLRLIRYACGENVLSETERDAYLRVWHLSHEKLTPEQRVMKRNLNQRIIERLNSRLDPDSE